MPLTEEQQSDIIEKLLDELESRHQKESPQDICHACKHELTYADVSNEVCACGAGLVVIPSLPIFQKLDVTRKKSIYKPVIYGRALLQVAMGTLLPIRETKFTSLLHLQDVPTLIVKLQRVQSKMKITTDKIDVEMTRRFLKKINKGCYYRYACFLTKILNSQFELITIPPSDIDRILVRFRAMARIFSTKKDVFNKKWGSKRKSLPFVPIMLRVVMENMGLENLARDLPHMKSKKREEKIKQMAQFLFNQSNFLIHTQ
jgi:hypothetical protein